MRWLLFLVAFNCWAQIEPAPKDCPPNDGYDWKPFEDRPSGKVMYVQAKDAQEFRRLCGYAMACALRFQEMTVVVSLAPTSVLSEAIRHHEACHDGWKHGPAPQVSLYR